MKKGDFLSRLFPLTQEQFSKALEYALEELPEIERNIIRRRCEGESLAQIAKSIGCSLHYVRYLQDKALQLMSQSDRKYALLVGVDEYLLKLEDNPPTPVASLNFDNRALRLLYSASLTTAEEVNESGYYAVSKIPGMGAKTLQEINDKMISHGFNFGPMYTPLKTIPFSLEAEQWFIENRCATVMDALAFMESEGKGMPQSVAKEFSRRSAALINKARRGVQ